MLTLWGFSVEWQLFLTALGLAATAVWVVLFVALKSTGRLSPDHSFDEFATEMAGLTAIGIVFIVIPLFVVVLTISFLTK
jgi:hypothetical protein